MCPLRALMRGLAPWCQHAFCRKHAAEMWYAGHARHEHEAFRTGFQQPQEEYQFILCGVVFQVNTQKFG
jgi:hypothetical protein